MTTLTLAQKNQLIGAIYMNYELLSYVGNAYYVSLYVNQPYSNTAFIEHVQSKLGIALTIQYTESTKATIRVK